MMAELTVNTLNRQDLAKSEWTSGMNKQLVGEVSSRTRKLKAIDFEGYWKPLHCGPE